MNSVIVILKKEYSGPDSKIKKIFSDVLKIKRQIICQHQKKATKNITVGSKDVLAANNESNQYTHEDIKESGRINAYKALKAVTAESGTYYIRNANSNLYLNAEASAYTNLIQHAFMSRNIIVFKNPFMTCTACKAAPANTFGRCTALLTSRAFKLLPSFFSI